LRFIAAGASPMMGRPGEGIETLYAIFTRKLDARTIDAYAASVENRDEQESGTITGAFQVIDSKATGLLTHVSMMIAGLGICAPLLAQHWVEETIIVTEISIYLLIAVGCLRCLSVLRSLRARAAGTELKESLQRELVIRHELYRICNRVSIVFTLLVFLSLPAMLWWHP
jgi:hypothetical protein